MKRVVAVVLSSVLAALPALAGQKPNKLISWAKAQALKAGTEIVLTATGGQLSKEHLLFADDATLVTRKAAP